MTLFDTHINLHGEQFDDDRDLVLQTARAAGVTRFISICDKIENFQTIFSLSKSHDDMWCSVGVHPHYAKDYLSLKAEDLIDYANDPVVRGIGETGLDQHYGYSDLNEQLEVLRQHIHAAQTTGLPLIIHSREADDEMGDILAEEMANSHFPLLMHCYTSGQRLADRAKELGAYFSVSGILSFKNATSVRDVISTIPQDKIILETDCPYLAPVPHRGRRNEPALLVDVCRAYAKLIDKDMDFVANLTTANALNLFQRVS
jgi:TatD DNase family protein